MEHETTEHTVDETESPSGETTSVEDLLARLADLEERVLMLDRASGNSRLRVDPRRRDTSGRRPAPVPEDARAATLGPARRVPCPL